MIGQHIRKLRLRCHFIGIIDVFQGPYVHSHGNSFGIITHNGRAIRCIIRQFQCHGAVLRLYCVFYAVYVHSLVIVSFRDLQGDFRGGHRSRGGYRGCRRCRSGCGYRRCRRCRSCGRRRFRCRGRRRCCGRRRCRIRLSGHILINRNFKHERIVQSIR